MGIETFYIPKVPKYDTVFCFFLMSGDADDTKSCQMDKTIAEII